MAFKLGSHKDEYYCFFVPSFDELDFLTFASIALPSAQKIALVRHQNAPYPGTELRVAPNLASPSTVVSEALGVLSLSLDDLD